MRRNADSSAVALVPELHVVVERGACGMVSCPEEIYGAGIRTCLVVEYGGVGDGQLIEEIFVDRPRCSMINLEL